MKDSIDRRGFLKVAGSAALTTGLLGTLSGCGSRRSSTRPEQEDDNNAVMTYRINPNSGDKVSILGYGCMRWPMVKDEEGKDVVDQEAVNHRKSVV